MRKTSENLNLTAAADLDWQAFCYVANELSDAERLAFEARLENDEAACEAVVRAVELSTTIQAAEVMTPVVQTSRSASSWQLRFSWLAVGAGVAAVAMALISSPQWIVPPVIVVGVDPAANVLKQEVVSTELAVAWSETLPAASDTLFEPVDQVVSVLSQAVPDNNENNTDDLPPSWMLAAVRGLAESEANLNVNSGLDAEKSEPALQ